jgi:hypothetical protein
MSRKKLPTKGVGLISHVWAGLHRRAMTRQQIAEFAGINDIRRANAMVNDLLALGLVESAGFADRKLILRACFRRAPGATARVSACKFRQILDAIDKEQGATRWQISDISGLNRRSVDNIVAAMHKFSALHVSAWERNFVGEPSAVYSVGPDSDAQRPRPMTCREYSQRCAVNRKSAALRVPSVFALGSLGVRA